MEVKMIPIDKIRPAQFQPRELFDKEKIAELTESIKEMDLIAHDRDRSDRPRAPGFPGPFQTLQVLYRYSAARACFAHSKLLEILQFNALKALEALIHPNSTYAVH